MSYLHLIYVGDFELSEVGILRLTWTPEDPVRKPVVRTPLDPVVLKRLALECSPFDEAGVIPSNWCIQLENGYLVCDRYGLGAEQIQFLKRLVEETSCRLYERGFEISVDDLEPEGMAEPVAQEQLGSLSMVPLPENPAIPNLKM
jgi:hypothetical protein